MSDGRGKLELKAYTYGASPKDLGDLTNDKKVYIAAGEKQCLTDEQKQQAYENMGLTDIVSAQFVRYDQQQELTEEQRRQARINIGTTSGDDVQRIIDELQEEMDERIGTEPLVGFSPDVDNVHEALNELAARPKIPEVDGVTIIRVDNPIMRSSNERIQATAIKGYDNKNTNRTVTVRDISNVEDLAAETKAEVDRIRDDRGGDITPYDFGWDGVFSSVSVGDKFNENREGVKTQITVVESGGDYPTGTNINVSDAKIKAEEFQQQVTAWAAQDIWNEDYYKFGDPRLTKITQGTQLTFITRGLKTNTEPFCEAFAISESLYITKLALNASTQVSGGIAGQIVGMNFTIVVKDDLTGYTSAQIGEYIKTHYPNGIELTDAIGTVQIRQGTATPPVYDTYAITSAAINGDIATIHYDNTSIAINIVGTTQISDIESTVISYGIWQKNGIIKLGSYYVDHGTVNEIIEVKVISTYNPNDEFVPHTIQYIMTEDAEVLSVIQREFGGDSGFVYEDDLIVWLMKHNPSEIFSGTTVINLFNDVQLRLTNTPNTTPPVFHWGIFRMPSENINFAEDEYGGIVKTQNTQTVGDITVYGVSLNANDQMYVPELGEDLKTLADSMNTALDSLETQTNERIQAITDSQTAFENDVNARLGDTTAMDDLADILTNEGWM
jgi:hypothetical protein